MTQKELYQIAKERYAELGIDTEAVIEKLSKVGISMRAFYPWGKEDAYLLEFYKTLGSFRRNNKVFKSGDFVPVFAEKGTFCFERVLKNERVLVCVNRWCDPVFIDAPKGYENAEVIFGSLPVDDKLKIDGLGFTVLKTKGSHK